MSFSFVIPKTVEGTAKGNNQHRKAKHKAEEWADIYSWGRSVW